MERIFKVVTEVFKEKQEEYNRRAKEVKELKGEIHALTACIDEIYREIVPEGDSKLSIYDKLDVIELQARKGAAE